MKKWKNWEFQLILSVVTHLIYFIMKLSFSHGDSHRRGFTVIWRAAEWRCKSRVCMHSTLHSSSEIHLPSLQLCHLLQQRGRWSSAFPPILVGLEKVKWSRDQNILFYTSDNRLGRCFTRPRGILVEMCTHTNRSVVRASWSGRGHLERQHVGLSGRWMENSKSRRSCTMLQ